MTAHAMAGDDQKSIKAGMNDHVTKPIDPDKLFFGSKYTISQNKWNYDNRYHHQHMIDLYILNSNPFCASFFASSVTF
jgi:CheY-like chemotaxis protein